MQEGKKSVSFGISAKVLLTEIVTETVNAHSIFCTRLARKTQKSSTSKIEQMTR